MLRVDILLVCVAAGAAFVLAGCIVVRLAVAAAVAVEKWRRKIYFKK